jgi:hypothetical protein
VVAPLAGSEDMMGAFLRMTRLPNWQCRKVRGRKFGCRRQKAATCCDQMVMVGVLGLVEALPSRVRAEALSNGAEG